MTNANVSVARRAVKAAYSVRVRHGYPLDRPCDVYELIAKQDLALQFIDVPSLEGMYLADSEVTRICVCARRPSGRQRLTAAHELGHRVLGHGTQLDAALELRDAGTESSVEEFSADTFAHYLLMPLSAVQTGFRLRGYDPAKPTAEQVYIVSGWLGVGFTTLLHHMRLSLGIIGFSEHRQLVDTDLKNLRADLVGQKTSSDVWILDEHWNGKDVHVQSGDYLTGLNSRGIEGFLKIVHCLPGRTVFSACRVGECCAKLDTCGTVKLGVSRKQFIGFYEYRYLEECD